MRIDKYIASGGVFSRKEASQMARRGLVTCNGKPVKDLSAHIDENVDVIAVNGEVLNYSKYSYVMLNKPDGYISSTEDSGRTVMKLLPPECEKIGMFPCGRLDVDTHGLLIITNDGPTAHRLLSPNHHAKKKYYFKCSVPLDDEKTSELESGICIGDYTTKPCRVEMINPNEGYITLGEGKFHQIKRMMEAVGSSVTYLKRIAFGGIELDESLNEGEFRYLTDEEIEILTSNK